MLLDTIKVVSGKAYRLDGYEGYILTAVGTGFTALLEGQVQEDLEKTPSSLEWLPLALITSGTPTTRAVGTPLIRVTVTSGAATFHLQKLVRMPTAITSAAGPAGASLIKVLTSTGGNDTAMIQAALSLGGEIYLAPGVFNVALNGVTYPGRGTGLALDIVSNTYLYGPGLIYPLAGTGSFAVLGNSSATLSNTRIEVKIDGSRLTGTGIGQCGGIVLFNTTDCDVSGSRVENIPSSGIMFRCTGASILGAILTVRAVATRCYISNIGYIGLQLHRAVNSRASSNVIKTTVDNSIDFEGNDEAGGLTNAGLGGTNLIQNNIFDGGNVGVFLESQGNVIVSGNIGRNLNVGVFANRIHSAALNFTVQGNRFHARPLNGLITRGRAGILIGNASGLCTIEGNHFDGFVNGFEIGTGFSMDIGKNTYANIQTYLVTVGRSVNALAQSRISEQVYTVQPAGYYPKNFPPNVTPGFVRTYNTTVAEAWDMYNNVPISSVRSTSATLTTRAAWGAASTFFASQTNVDIVPAPVAGSAWVLNLGVWFMLGTSTSGSELIVKNEAGADGNYTADFPAGRVVQIMTQTAYLEFKNN